MKMGDEMPVTMDGLHVGNAIIEEVDRDAGEVTMYIPATRFIVGLAESIVDKNPEDARELLVDHNLEQAEPVTSGASSFEAPQRLQEPISEPRGSRRETAGERELREAYSGSGSLHDMNLDSSAID